LRRTHRGYDGKGKLITPKHWSGLDFFDRAKRADPKYEKLWRLLVPWLSWYVHGGAVAFGRVHVYLHELFKEAVEVTCDCMKLFVAKPKLRDQVQQALLVIGKTGVEAKFKELEKAKPKTN
jgi:hypothetical protein